MKPLDRRSNQAPDENECAAEVLATVFPIMLTLRNGMRSQRPADLTEPQFRAMGFLSHHEGVSLSDMADDFGLTLPTVSKMVDGLVKRGFLSRQEDPDDRRRVTLRLTDNGKSVFDTAKRNSDALLADLLKTLSHDEQEQVVCAMRILRRVFAVERETQ